MQLEFAAAEPPKRGRNGALACVRAARCGSLWTGMADDEAPTVHSYDGARNQLGQRHGTGTSTFPNGDKFEGEPRPRHRKGESIICNRAPHASRRQLTPRPA